MSLPTARVAAQMKGNVIGFPIAVPNAEAARLPLINSATVAAMMKWKPTNGKNDANTPAATPAATACGAAVRRRIRFVK